jgi:hypothetical protein
VVDKSGNNVFEKQKYKTELGSCTNGHLGISNDKEDYLGLKKGYQCPQNIDYKIKGSFSG